jgi:periplasmic divalent cation tolerance protein
MARSWDGTIGAFWEPRLMQDCKDLDILSITTTVASRGDAEAFAHAVLQRRLAACVQLEEGLTSFYHWQGRDCADAELRLTIKTLPACVPALRALFDERHPYEVPQFLAVTMQASPAYFEWVAQQVSLPPGTASPDAH